MDFVNPMLLYGATAAVVPIVLHLIMRQRPRPLVFPALRLIQQRRQANTRRLRLRHWLLLLMRMAALVLLALALARPSINASGLGADQELPVSAVLIFDTSVRMTYRHENRTRLEQAQELGRWLLAQLPPQSQVAVLESSLSSAVYQVDLAAARERIGRLGTVTVERPLQEIFGEAARLLKAGQHSRREIYVFSDLTAAGWPRQAQGALARPLEGLSDLGLYLIDVGVEQPKNVGLGELVLSAQSLARTSQLAIRTDVGSVGVAGPRTIELWVEDASGRASKRSQETATLSPDAPASVEFVPFSLELGVRQGSVRVVGEDALTADDVRYFTVQVEPAWRVLLVGEAPAVRSVRLVEEALAPRSFRQSGRARFDCRVADYADLSGERLEGTSAVLLVDPPSLKPEIWQALAEFVFRGGGLGIFLGPSAQPVARFNEPAAQELLPGPLAQQARRPESDLFLRPLELSHPILARFRPLGDGVPWDTLPVTRYWQFEHLIDGCQAVLPYSNGEPALIERSVGAGRVLTLTTPAAPRPGESPWNLLPTGIDAWPYLILMNELTLYLCGANDATFNYRAGQVAVVRARGRSVPSSYVLTAPNAEPQRRGADPRQSAIAITATDLPGNYLLQAGGQDDRFVAGFSVNLSPESTQLTRLTAEEIDTLLEPLSFELARTQEEIRRQVSLGRVGRELYP